MCSINTWPRGAPRFRWFYLLLLMFSAPLGTSGMMEESLPTPVAGGLLLTPTTVQKKNYLNNWFNLYSKKAATGSFCWVTKTVLLTWFAWKEMTLLAVPFDFRLIAVLSCYYYFYSNVSDCFLSRLQYLQFNSKPVGNCTFHTYCCCSRTDLKAIWPFYV